MSGRRLSQARSDQLCFGFIALSELSVSIVVYHSDPTMLARGLASLDAAVACLVSDRPGQEKVLLTLIDNGVQSQASLASDARSFETQLPSESSLPALRVRRLAGHGNVGYGAGHNLAIQSANSRFHLILNPDVDLATDALKNAVAYLESHPDVVALSPRVCGADGRLQYLCRRYPSLADLFIRGFLPATWRARFDKRLARYEMREEIDAQEHVALDNRQPPLSPSIISGCFMLFRTEPLRQLGGFDPRYFLYFEDYDLSLRARRLGRLAYVPSVNIVHYGGGASRKGRSHVMMFLKSALQFFNRFGWRLL